MRNKIIISGILVILIVAIFSHFVHSAEKDSDGDGIPDSIDQYPYDYDNDGMPDIWEKKYGLRYDKNDANEDLDGDGISNIDEYRRGTNPAVSEKNNVKVQPTEFLSPTEKTMVKVMIWAGIFILISLVLIFILYGTHIVRIVKFAHHASKAHFAKLKADIPKMIQQTAPYRYMRPQQIVSAPPISVNQAPPMQEYRMPVQQRPAAQEARNEEAIKYKVPVQPRPAAQEARTEEARKKPADVFERLNQHIEEHKDNFSKLAMLR